jgi:hypothetical protein
VNSPRTGAASKWVRRAAAGPRRISSNCLVILPGHHDLALAEHLGGRLERGEDGG